MIEWPESLITEIARRRVIFFIGSGVSSSVKDEDGNKPPTWDEYLEKALDLVKDRKLKSEIQKLIKDKNLLLALQAIKDASIPQDYNKLLDSQFNNKKIKAGELHEHIFDLDLKIIITTNFDRIYDRYCDNNGDEDYKFLTYDSLEIGDALRSDNRLIIKAHGCVNEPKKMIFTRHEYHNAKEKHPQFYDILKALFITHTCVFIGCGMEDPDILLTLEDVKIASSSSYPHYFLSKENKNNNLKKLNLEKIYNIKTLEYGPNHVDLITDIKSLKEEVLSYRQSYNIS